MASEARPAQARQDRSFFSEAGRRTRNLIPHLTICLSSPSVQAVASAAIQTRLGLAKSRQPNMPVPNPRWIYLKAGFKSGIFLTSSAVKSAFSTLRAGWHLGKNPDANYVMRKNWMDTAYSIGGVSVGAMGTVYPPLGSISTASFFYFLVRHLSIKSNEDIPTLPAIREIYRRNKPFFAQVIQMIGDQNQAPIDQVRTAISNVDGHVTSAVSSEQLFDTIYQDLAPLVPEPPPSEEMLYYQQVAENIQKGTQELNDIMAGKYLKDIHAKKDEVRPDPTWEALEAELRKVAPQIFEEEKKS